MPSLHIVSIAGKNVPENPNGSFGTPDILLPGNTSNPISLVVQAVNVPVGSQVTVKAHPQVGSTATGSGPLAGTLESSLATIDLNISTAYSTVITASVAYQLTVALYLDGERVESVRVAATLGGASEMTYITESGREIPVYL
jgi:hypothetical protein